MADLLSRQPQQKPSHEDEVEVYECRSFEEHIVAGIAASSRRLDQLRQAQLQDEVCAKVRQFCENGWPKYMSSVDIILKPYWEIQHELTVVNGLLLRGTRFVVPSQERLLSLIHI